MKRLIFLGFLLFLSISSFSQIEIKTVTRNLNLRESPGIDQKILCTIPKNTNLTVNNSLQEYINWTKVEYNGHVGYVYNEYLQTPQNDNQNYQFNAAKTKVTYYRNSKGEKVQSPTYYTSPPAGATAICKDGTYSFSRSRRGTCSHHGGVRKWL